MCVRLPIYREDGFGFSLLVVWCADILQTGLVLTTTSSSLPGVPFPIKTETGDNTTDAATTTTDGNDITTTKATKEGGGGVSQEPSTTTTTNTTNPSSSVVSMGKEEVDAVVACMEL